MGYVRQLRKSHTKEYITIIIINYRHQKARRSQQKEEAERETKLKEGKNVTVTELVLTHFSN